MQPKVRLEQNTKVPKYKHDKIPKDKIQFAKIQMEQNTNGTFCSICILFHLYFVAIVLCYICILAICILSCLCFRIFVFCSFCILFHLYFGNLYFVKFGKTQQINGYFFQPMQDHHSISSKGSKASIDWNLATIDIFGFWLPLLGCDKAILYTCLKERLGCLG